MQSQSNYNDAQGAGKAENIYGTTGSSSYNASGNQGQTGNNVTGLNDTTLNSGRVEPGAPDYLGPVDNSFGSDLNNQASNLNTQDLSRGQGINTSNSTFSSLHDNNNFSSNSGNSGNLHNNGGTGNGYVKSTHDYLGSGPAVGSGGIFQGSEITSDLTSTGGRAGDFDNSSRSYEGDSVGTGGATDTEYGNDRNKGALGSLNSGFDQGTNNRTGNFYSISDNNNTSGQRSHEQNQPQQYQQQQTSQSQSQSQPQSQSQSQSSGDGFGGSNLQSAPKTGNATVDNAVGQLGNKLDQQTDEDGFTNLTGDKSAPGILTGRVKNDANSSESPIIETTSSRSERDSQGRELDSYGKPYDL